MATIIAPQTITPAPCSKFWITSLNIVEMGATRRLDAFLKLWDGTATLLFSGAKEVHIANVAGRAVTDSTFAAIVSALDAEVVRQAIAANCVAAEDAAEPQIISVTGSDPAQPVRATVVFKTQPGKHFKPLIIQDVFAKAATDMQFAGVLMGMIAETGRQAQLTVT